MVTRGTTGATRGSAKLLAPPQEQRSARVVSTHATTACGVLLCVLRGVCTRSRCLSDCDDGTPPVPSFFFAPSEKKASHEPTACGLSGRVAPQGDPPPLKL
jgi:hypothetical protein